MGHRTRLSNHCKKAVTQLNVLKRLRSFIGFEQKRYLYSLFYSDAGTWNEIPLEIRMSSTITIFKRKLKDFLQISILPEAREWGGGG